MSKVKTSAIPELQRFATGLERDKAAVVAGLTLIHSNGQVEGQVIRIKLIKRMMFGRAGFARLAPACSACALSSPTVLTITGPCPDTCGLARLLETCGERMHERSQWREHAFCRSNTPPLGYADCR